MILILISYLIDLLHSDMSLSRTNTSLIDSFLSLMAFPFFTDNHTFELRASTIRNNLIHSLLSPLHLNRTTSEDVFRRWITSPLTSKELDLHISSLQGKPFGRYPLSDHILPLRLKEELESLFSQESQNTSVILPTVIPVDLSPSSESLTLSAPLQSGYHPPHLRISRIPPDAQDISNHTLNNSPYTSSSSSSSSPDSRKNNPLHVFLPDDRRELVNTTFPWSSVGLLLSVKGVCTGTLVADDLVLTASHCIPWREDGSIDRIRFPS